MTRSIPKLEEDYEPFATLLARNLELNSVIASLRREAAEVRQQMDEGDRITREDRISAIAAGTPFADPGPVKERLADILLRLRDSEDAVTLISDQMRVERQQGSRVISAKFAQEHRSMLSTFWEGIAKAAQASLAIHDLHNDLNRAGVEPKGLSNPDISVFDEYVVRSSSTASKLRRAAADGLIDLKIVPEVLR
jgi:hypothetical protein